MCYKCIPTIIYHNLVCIIDVAKKVYDNLTHLTLIVGNDFLSWVLFSPGILPADLPSHSYLNLRPLCFGCSTISVQIPSAVVCGLPVALIGPLDVDGPGFWSGPGPKDCRKAENI